MLPARRIKKLVLSFAEARGFGKAVILAAVAGTVLGFLSLPLLDLIVCLVSDGCSIGQLRLPGIPV